MRVWESYEYDDADGNRGMNVINYEIDEDDREWIVDELYDWFVEDSLQDTMELSYIDDKYGEIFIEVDAEEYIGDIVEKLYEDDEFALCEKANLLENISIIRDKSIVVLDRWEIIRDDGSVYDTEKAEDIPQWVFKIRDIYCKAGYVKFFMCSEENKIKSFILVCKYVFNRMDFDKFRELFEKAFASGVKFDNSYITEKWDNFQNNMLSFLLNHKEFVAEIIEEIEKTNYKG